MTPFERSLSKLSENHKNFDIGSTVLKLSCIYFPCRLSDVRAQKVKFSRLAREKGEEIGE